MNKFIRQQATRTAPSLQSKLDTSEAAFHNTDRPRLRFPEDKTWAERRAAQIRFANVGLVWIFVIFTVVWAIALYS